MEKTIDLMDLLYLTFKRKLIIILCGLIGMTGAYLYSSILVSPTYTASVKLYVKSAENQMLSVYEGTSINAARSLVNTCINIINEEEVLQRAADIINEENNNTRLTGNRIKSMISMSQENSTEILKIQITSVNSEEAARICNVLANDVVPIVMEEVIGFSPTQPINQAKVPTVKSSPNIRKDTMYGGAIGIILAVGVIFVLYLLDNTIKGEEDIKNRFKIPVLAEIPDFLYGIKERSFLKKRNRRKATIAVTRLSKETPFAIREAYKILRSNLSFALGTKNNNVVMISSPGPNESKSTTCSNLAITIAEAGKKVLLIDADMRKPVQHKIFGVKNTAGLSGILAGLTTNESWMQQNVVKNLDLITSGPIPPNPSELLGSDNMKKLLYGVSKRYDVILVDTPPVNVVTDALAMSPYTAGLVMACRYGNTTYGALQNAIASIEFSRTSILGIVITEWHHADSSYKSYKEYNAYKYKYEYLAKSEE